MAYASATGGYGAGSTSVIHPNAAHPDAIVVPDAELLFRGDYKRAGPDLVITGPDGRHHLVPGYFSSEKHPALVAPNGASLAPDLIDLLAGSPTPGQYAQAQPATPPDSIGKVEKVIGNVTVIRNGVAVALHVGDAVYKSDVVQTGANSSVGIGFPDGTALNLVANTRMALNEYSFDAGGTANNALFTLVEGTFAFVAGKVAHEGDMKIATPVATMGIRGTTGVVEQVTVTAVLGQTAYSFSIFDDYHKDTHGAYTLLEYGVSISNPGMLTIVTPQGVGQPPIISTQPMSPAQLMALQGIVNGAFNAYEQFNNNSPNSGAPGSSTPLFQFNFQQLLQNNGGDKFTFTNFAGSNGLPGTVGSGPPIASIVQGIGATDIVIWTGANGNWSDAFGWNDLLVPGNPRPVIIPQSKVTVSNAQTAGGIIVGQGASLNIIAGGSLTVANQIGSFGVIQLNSTGADPTLIIQGDVFLYGGGTLEMLVPPHTNNPGLNRIIGVPGTNATLINENVTIRGSGTIGADGGALSLINAASGVIKAVGGTLILDTAGAIANAGLLAAAPHATLKIYDDVADIGSIKALGGTQSLPGGNVVLLGHVITGGTLSAGAFATIEIASDGHNHVETLRGVDVSNSGVLLVDPSATLALKGTTITGYAGSVIADNGTIDVVVSSTIDGTIITGGEVDIETGQTLTLDDVIVSGSTIAPGDSVFQGVIQGPPPPTFTWKAGTTGNWATGSDWSGGVVPDGTSNARIVGTATEIVTVSEDESVNALTLNDTHATLVVTHGATLSVYGDFIVAAVHSIDVTQGTLYLGGSHSILDNTKIDLGGAGAGFGVLTLAQAVTFGPHLTLNFEGGQINAEGLLDNKGSMLFAAGSSSASTLQAFAGFSNHGTMVFSGQGGAGSIQSFGAFDNEGTIAVVNGYTATLDFADISNIGALPVINNGTIAVRSGAHLTIDGPSPLQGSGSLVIGNQATLELADTVANGVHFAVGAVGTLQLDVAAGAAITGTVFGLALGDAIDFTDSIISDFSINGKILTVTLEGEQPFNITLAAPLSAGLSFQTEADGHGGQQLVVAHGPLPSVLHTWVDGTTGDWGTAANWSHGVPDGKSDAEIAGNTTETVTVSTDQSVDLLTLENANATLAVTDGATLSVFGGVAAGSTARAIDIAHGTLLVGGGEATLDNTTLHLGAGGSQGTLSVPQGTTLTLGPDLTVDVADGQISGPGALDNEGSISVVGSGATLNIVMGPGEFTNAETGKIIFGAQDAANLIQADQGGGFNNKGSIIVQNGDTLSLFVAGQNFNLPALNDGTILVDTDGHLIIGGQLGGSGTITIGADATLELFSGSVSNAVNFADGAVGTLQLDITNGADFTGPLSGLELGDTIDFASAEITGFSLDSGTLSVSLFGGQTVVIAIDGSLPEDASLFAQIDGRGGYELVVADEASPLPPTYTWVDGTTGDWGTASNWSGDVVPDGTSNATIGGSATETITVSSNESVNVLTVSDANATLEVTGAATFSVYGGAAVSAAQAIDVADGTLAIGGFGEQTLDNTSLALGSDSSAGQLFVLPGTALTFGPNLIVEVARGQIIASGPLDNKGTISVENGSESLFTLSAENFVNEGTVTFSGQGGLGTISVFGGFDNNNSIAVENGYTLLLNASNLNTGSVSNDGTISVGSGGRVVVDGLSTLAGNGSFAINDGGILEIAGSVADSVNFATSEGIGILQLDVTRGAAFTGTLSGLALGDIIDFANAMIADAAIVGNTLTVDLLGGQTIAINLAGPLPNGDALEIELDGHGGGELVVVNASFDNGPGTISVDAGDKLTLKDGATIAGTPIDSLGTVEVAAGLVTLNGVAFSNLGILKVDSDATLTLDATTISNATDAGTNTGSVTVAAGGLLKLDNATIQYGTVSVLEGGEIETVAGTSNLISTPTGPVDPQSAPSINIAGEIVINDSSSLTLISPVEINNIGTIELHSTGGQTFLYFDQQFPVLSGGGHIKLDGGTGAQDIIAAAPGLGFVVNLDNQNNLISGAGEIGQGGGALTLQNDLAGVIDADIDGERLVLNTGTMSNAGLLQASNGGLLVFENETVTNYEILSSGNSTVQYDGTIQVGGASTLVLDGSTVTGGTINNHDLAGNGTIEVSGNSTIAGATLNHGNVTIDADQTLTLDNDIVNGTIFADTAAGAALAVDSGDTLTLNDVTITGGALDVASGATLYLNNTHIIGVDLSEIHGTLIIIGNSTIDGLTNVIGGQTTVESGQTLFLNDAFVFGTITNHGTIEVTGNSTIEAGANIDGGNLTVDSDVTLTLGGVTIDGTAIADNGTVEVSGNSTFEGNTTLDGGNLTVDSNHTLTLDQVAVNGTAISDNGGIEISGDNTFAGNVSVTGGNLTVDGNQTLTLDQVTVNGTSITDHGTIEVAGDSTFEGNLSVTGGDLTVDGNQTLTLDQVTVNGTSVTDNGTIEIAGDSTFAGNASVTGGDLTVDGNQTLTLDQVTVNGTSITDHGTIEIAGDSTFAGNASVTGGDLTVDGNQTLTLDQVTVNGTSITDHGTIEVTGDSTFEGNASVTGGNLTVDGNQTLTLDQVTINGTSITDHGTIEVAGDSTFAGNASVTGGDLTVDGNQTLTLDQVTVNGTSVTDHGTIEIAGDSTFESNASVTGGDLTVDGNQTLTLDQVTVNGTSVADHGTIEVTGDSTFEGNASVTGGDLTVDGNQTLTLDQVTVNGTSITDHGTIEVAGDSTFAGNASVTGGDLAVDGNQTLTLDQVTVNGTAIGDVGTIEVAGNSTLDGVDLGGGGNVTVDDGVTLTLKNDVTLDGLTLSGNVSDQGTVTVDGNQTLTLDGAAISGGNISDAGTIEVAGNSTLDNVDLTGGNLTVDGNHTLMLTGNVTLDDVALSGNVSNDAIIVDGNHTLTLDGASISGGNVSDAGTIDVAGNSTLDGVDLSGGGNLTVDDGVTLALKNDVTLDDLTLSGNVSDQGTVTVDGNHTLTLDGASISGGNISDGDTIEVAGNSTLDDVDVTGGNLTVDANQTLTLTGNVTLDDVTLSGNVSDQGTVTVDGNHTLTLDGASINGGNLTDTGTIEVTGNSTLDNVDLSGGGNLTVDSGQVLTLAGNVTLDDVALSGNVSNDAIIVDGNHTLTLDGASISGGNITDNGTIEVAGNSTLDHVDLSGGGNLTVDDGKTLTLDHASIDGSTIDLGAGGAGQSVTEISVSNLNAIGPSISTDGEYVAFIASSNLPGQGSDLGSSVIELYDAGNGQLTEISAGAPPLPDGETSEGFSNIPSISADGRYVVFDEKYLIANDQGPPIETSEVLLYDGQSQTVTVVQDSAGHAAISGNGQYVAMQAHPPPDGNSSNGESVLVTDRSGNVRTDITGDPDAPPPSDSENFGGAGSVYDPGISSDGRFVTFWTTAAKIAVDGTIIQTNNSTGNAEVYVYDRQNETLQMVSVGEQGEAGNGDSGVLSLSNHDNAWPSSLSADGRYVVFQSMASNLVDGAGDQNGVSNIFLYDTQTHTTQLVSIGLDGAAANGASYRPEISADGDYITFASTATNLVTADTGGQAQTYLYDTQTGSIELVSTAADGTPADNESDLGSAVSADGSIVAFGSLADNLVANGPEGYANIFLVTPQTNEHSGTLDIAGDTQLSNVQLSGGKLIIDSAVALTLSGVAVDGTAITDAGSIGVTGNSTFENVHISGSGNVTVGSGVTLTLADTDDITVATFDNSGHVVAGNASLVSIEVGTATNELGGRLEATDGGTLTLTESEPGSENYGTVEASNGGNLTITHLLTQIGNVTIAATATTEATGVIKADDGTLTINNVQGDANYGTIEATNDGTLTLNVTEVPGFSGGGGNFGTFKATYGGTLIVNNGFLNNDGGTIKAVGDGSAVEFANGNLGGVNAGTIEAKHGGTISIEFFAIDNAGGTIAAYDDGSTVKLSNVAIAGGALATGDPSGDDCGIIQIVTPAINHTNVTVFNGSLHGTLTVDGFVQVESNATLELIGAIDNEGTIDVDGVADLAISGTVTLNGAGAVKLETSDDEITGVASGAELYNYSTISGGGDIGAGSSNLTLVNEATGVIDASGGAANPLVIDTGGNALTNAGLLEATTGSLYIRIATIDNTGTDPLDTGGHGATGVLLDGGSLVLDVDQLQLTGGGTLALNNGTIEAASADIIGDPILENVDNTIVGYGSIISGDGDLVLHNDGNGTIDANAAGHTLTIDTGNTVSNAGILEASNTATLQIADSVDNSGLIQASGGSTLDIEASTINWTGSEPATGSNGIVLAGSTDVLLVDAAGGTLTLTGTHAGGAVSLAGGLINDNGTSETLDNFNNDISGYGSIGDGDGNLTLHNDSAATIDANAAGHTLTIDTGNTVSNAGILEATGTGTLQLVDDVDNSGLIQATGGSTLDIEAGTISWTGSDPAAGSNGIVLAGSTDVLLVDATGGTLTLTGTSAGGAVSLAGGMIDDSGSGVTLDNFNNSIFGYGSVGDGDDYLTLQNDSAAIIDANYQFGALTLGTGSNAIINTGLLEATNYGVLTIQSVVDNFAGNISGTVEAASGGYVDVQNDIHGGQAIIVDGTLEYDAHSDVATAFTDGVQGALVLGANALFTGTVSGFAAGDAIDFKGIDFGSDTQLTYVAENNTLMVSDGQGDEQIVQLAGDGYSQSSFALFDDGTGHAAITVLQSDPGADNWLRDAASTRDLFQYVSDPTATWLIAQAGAVSAGGYLAAVTGPEENSFILNLTNGQTAWLGGSDNESGTWQWVAGPLAGQPFSYVNWNPLTPEPSDSNHPPFDIGEHFLQFLGNSPTVPPGTWNDEQGPLVEPGTGTAGYVIETNLAPLANAVSDTLTGDAIDSGKWNVYLPTVTGGAADDASATPTANGVELHDHAYLQSVDGFTPTAATPLHVSLSFTLGDSFDYVAVTDRTDGTTDSSFGGPANGIEFLANWGANGNKLEILDAATGQFVDAAADVTFDPSTLYDVSITDNGSNQTFTVTDHATGQVTASVAANFTDPAAGNLVTITNREANDGDHTATVSNVSVSTAYEGTEGSTLTLTGITDEGISPAAVQSYVITGFPTDATFSEGALSGDQWVISDPAQIAALAITPLTITPPADYTGTFTLEVEAVAAGNTTVTQDFAVTISAPTHWVGASDDWTTGSDWSTDSAPTTGTDAVIDAAGTYAVTITSADVAQSLTINAADATVSDQSGGSLALAGALTVAAGEFDLTGGALLATTIDVANAGSFVGYGTLQSSVHNDGTIEASGAGLHIAGAVTGTGAFTIDDGATLEFGSSVGTGTTVSFAGPTGILKLDAPWAFAGQISGTLNTGDVIDLGGFNSQANDTFQTSTFYNGTFTTLIVTDETQGTSEFVRLAGDHTNAVWAVSADGSGGAKVTDPPAVESAATANGVAGMIAFVDTGSDTPTATVTPEGSNYIGTFTLDPLTKSNGIASLGFHFDLGDDQINLAPGQTLTQSYGISVADAQHPALNVSQTVAVSVGGAGNDNFVFQPGLGADTIVNFDAQHDTIELDHFANAQSVQQLESLITADAHGDAVIALGHNDSITVAGVTAAQLQQLAQSGHVIAH